MSEETWYPGPRAWESKVGGLGVTFETYPSTSLTLHFAGSQPQPSDSAPGLFSFHLFSSFFFFFLLPQCLFVNPHAVVEEGEKQEGERWRGNMVEGSNSLSLGLMNEFCTFKSFCEEIVGFWVNSDKNWLRRKS